MENKKMFSNSIFYLISSILMQGINLILLPIYTKNITPSEFGQYNLISSLQSLLSIFFTLGIFSGLSRFFNETENKNKLKNTALTFSILWGGLCCIIFGYLLNSTITNIVFKDDILGNSYVKYIVINSTMMCLISIYTSYYSMTYKALKVCIINISQVLLTLCFTYYYLVIIKFGILGIYRAQLISFFIVFISIFILDIKNYRIVLVKKDLKNMLGYGVGLAPGQISAWVLTLIDRYFIKGMINLNAVAVYSMGYKIGMLIDPLFLNPFRSSFTPFKFSVYKEHNSRERIKKIFNYFNFIGWFIILGLSIFSDIAIKILSTQEYNQSYKVVAIIAFSYYLWGLAEFYGLGLLIANKMFINSLIVVISAVFNTTFNYLLIPKFGIYGAAIATCIAYFITNILYYLTGRRYYNLNITVLEPYKCGVIFFSLYGIYMLYKANFNNMLLELLLNIVLCIAYVALGITLRIISWKSIKNLINRVNMKIYNKTCR
ncbi:hypothetical protein LF65_01183 [Clostridium beijerinckii]|uniref:Uncharacterized protein n=1 Tax=Clostridium beijerinckii TaxID=1520 RepID=A0A0B5QIN1_CLOBE|nr:polysaccharide biosynthesis C-terminal domain-containing protein [Clostridium beijerinckii]AJG97797.1 hypothetical protein LF65_01183 [Clostridium beijerinckii]